MSSLPCTNCGAEITPGTKFCRQCGQPSLDTSSVSEAATRVFEATRERGSAPTQTWNAQPTGPAYMAPSDASPLQDAAATRSLEPTAQRPQKSRLILLFVILFVAMLGAFAVGMMLRSNSTITSTPTPPVVARPGTDLPPPPPPPPPIEQPPASGPSVPTSELMYPGAETVMDMKNERDSFLELRTTDPANKVVDWYTSKLKATEIIKTPGAGAVLRTGGTTVIISSRGNATDILLKQGVEP